MKRAVILLLFLVACVSPRVQLERQLESTFNLVDAYVNLYDDDAQDYLIQSYPEVHERAVNVLKLWRRTGAKPSGADSVSKELRAIQMYVTRALDTNLKK